MPKSSWALLAILPLCGCGFSSGVVPVGPGTYAISEMRAPALGGGPEAYRLVLAAADWFCRGQGRGVRMLELRPDGDPRTRYWPTAFDAIFECVPASK